MNHEWKPIETAPKDGTAIILYRPTAPEWMRVTIGVWNDDKYKEKPRPYWEMWVQREQVSQISRPCQPTHWMYIPPPPQ